MDTPVWAYVVGILVAIPAYILWAVGAYMLIKVLLSWLFLDPSPSKPVEPARPAKPGPSAQN